MATRVVRTVRTRPIPVRVTITTTIRRKSSIRVADPGIQEKIVDGCRMGSAIRSTPSA